MCSCAYCNERLRPLQRLNRSSGSSDSYARGAPATNASDASDASRTSKAVAGEVFGPALCPVTLATATVSIADHDAGPPLWMDLLRCLLQGKKDDLVSLRLATGDDDMQHQHQQPDRLALAAAASVWIGSDGPHCDDGLSGGVILRGWMKWYGAKLVPLLPARDGGGSGRWLVLSCSVEHAGRGVEVRAGQGWPPRVLAPSSWEDLGRSPLEAAWHLPAGRPWASEGGHGGVCPPPIVLPPFAAWLRIVLRGAPTCEGAGLDAYLRRMAREVFLPCEFGGASSEMARQWLGVLIEAEALAEASTRGAAVAMFFRDELLRLGSGEHPAAPVGGPLTWLWPLEAVVSACGRAGPLGACVTPPRNSRRGVAEGDREGHKQAAGEEGAPTSALASALARALSTVPDDLLCGSRRFGAGAGRTPPATLRAFATRAVDLAARALASPACRHPSVAKRLLLGLGLLYHALARPVGPRGGAESASTGAPAALGARGTRTKGWRGATGETDCEAANAQGVALGMIETLVRIAHAASPEAADDVRRQAAAPGGPGRGKPGSGVLPSSCRALLPLDVGDRERGWVDYMKALSGAGAWRAARAFVRNDGIGPRLPDCSPAATLPSPATSEFVVSPPT